MAKCPKCGSTKIIDTEAAQTFAIVLIHEKNRVVRGKRYPSKQCVVMLSDWEAAKERAKQLRQRVLSLKGQENG